MTTTSAPLSSIEVGDISITYLPDGIHHARPLAQFTGWDEATWASRSHALDDEGWLVVSLGSLLVRNGQSNTLIDLGFGPRSVDITQLTDGAQEGDLIGGQLLDSLAAVQLTAADIDAVLFTHLHLDHVGWAEAEGRPTFPNATYHVGATEWEYWRSGHDEHPTYGASEVQLDAMATRLEVLADLDSPALGITTLSTPGHTPGHVSFMISSGSSRALVLGDLAHCPVELGNTELNYLFDVDPVLARQTRERIERELEKPDTILAGAHFPNLVFGRILPGSVPMSVDFSLSRVLS